MKLKYVLYTYIKVKSVIFISIYVDLSPDKCTFKILVSTGSCCNASFHLSFHFYLWQQYLIGFGI